MGALVLFVLIVVVLVTGIKQSQFLGKRLKLEIGNTEPLKVKKALGIVIAALLRLMHGPVHFLSLVRAEQSGAFGCQGED